MLKQTIWAVATICALAASAQSNSLADAQIDSTLRSNKIIFIDGKPAPEQTQRYVDSVRHVISAFYYDQFRHFQDPGSPYFLFMSKDAQLAMGIGGAVRMRAYYDWGGAVPSPAFAPYLIPMQPDPANRRQFGTTPAGTCLFFRVLGQNKTLGNYQLYIEANFNGYEARDFHLKKAYAIINDFTVGYASSTFSDPAAVPPTVDAQGPNNKVGVTSVLIRYMPVVKEKWYFAVSVETPSDNIDIDGINTKKVTNWMPDWAAFAQYEWARGQHVRLSGVVRTLSYRNLIAEKNRNVVGWGTMVSSVAHPHPNITTYASATYGRGFEGTGGDLQIGSYDLVANPHAPGHMYAPEAFGWNLGLQYNFKPNIFATVQMSQTRFLPSKAVSPDEYKYGLYWVANVFWNLTPRMQVAAEIDFAKRQNFSGDHRYARRAGLMCQFSF